MKKGLCEPNRYEITVKIPKNAIKMRGKAEIPAQGVNYLFKKSRIVCNRLFEISDGRKMKVEYKTIPCTKDDEELIDGKLTEINHAVVPPCEGTEEEELVFKIENGEGTVIAGCNVGIDN